MTFSSAIGVARSLTHPAGYQARPEVMEKLGTGAVIYAEHDQAILGHQVRLVDRVVEGSIDKSTFLRNVGHLENFEIMRARLRGDGGLSLRERATLQGEMKKLAGKMVALPQFHKPASPIVEDKEAVGLLFDELATGAISITDAVEELHWRCGKKYGNEVSRRSGPVYADERPKLRSALARNVRPESSAEASPPPGPVSVDTLSLVRKAIGIFDDLDINDDGVVDRTEARGILAGYKNLGLTAPEAAALYSRQAVLAEVVDPGPRSFEKLSLDDLQALLPKNPGAADSEAVGAADSDSVASALSLLGSRLADQQSRELIPNLPLYFSPDGPDGHKVAQGLEGSCWFLGALPAVDTSTLKSCLTDQGDHYLMRFADGSSETVAPLTEAERRVYSRGDGAWSGLMEIRLDVASWLHSLPSY